MTISRTLHCLPPPAHCIFPFRLNSALKSQVEFALVNSLTKLSAEIEQSYAVLPLPWTFGGLLQVVTEEILEKRREERRKMLLIDDRECNYEGNS